MADPVVTVPLITLKDLTEGKIGGTGVFDVLMETAGLHVQREFDKNRIKGQDYAQVYLTAMQYVLQNSSVFLLQKDEAANKALLVQAQIDLTKLQAELLQKEIDRELLTRDLLEAQAAKVRAETVNIITENDSLLAQQCLLKAQYDLTMVQKLQTTAQTSLVQQKIATEKAQTVDIGIDENSVIGRQKALYKAQTDGFKRDAEQKAAKMLIDTWNIRRTTDEGTIADETNKLSDATIGRAVTKVLDGIEA
ncbi:virion structural protein [Pseudomonas phage Littlefix]|uniref:Uncharacterized protein n=1 Tax=Pseudomonas phage Littlefix TaxID=2079289 RepID=A0A2K9VHM6_9CAUD|nr:virion structural protein [Pseudomonas phage Littlefix]AUV61830.1 hypothetical protein PsPhLittlefix_gp15 [Pseudomonas phage Littlefix]